MWTPENRKYMRCALRLAEKGLGRTAPNPAVGAVVVKNGMIVGEGFHKKAGTPHAEIHALNAAGKDAKDATLYVTLEPCNHTGRTPPCSQAILEAGIKKVYVGTRDPNPEVEGEGSRCLEDHGVRVYEGLLEDECRLIIAPFAKHLVAGIPWVRSKVACSMDGRIASRTGHSKWITNEAARAFSHHLRDISDGILVGKETVLADDPRLTCRLRKGTGKDPARIVLDSSLSLEPTRSICTVASSAPTIIVGVEGKANERRKRMLEEAGVKVWFLSPDSSGRVNLLELLEKLGESGIQSLLVEGGSAVQGAFWDQRLVDEAFFFYAPIIIGGVDARPAIGGEGVKLLSSAPRLNAVRTRKFGDNWMIQGLTGTLDDLWSERERTK